MLPDIFSSFDPAMSKSFIPLTSIFLMISIILLTSTLIVFHPSSNRFQSIISLPTSTMFSQFIRTSSKSLKSLPLIGVTLFITIITINLLGMNPYTFSMSSHLILTLSIGLPMWLSLLISSFSLNTKASIAHFLPDGAPDWLNPFLVLIESTSILVRPLTLSFRLAANMTAGHIVLSLIGSYCSTGLLNNLTQAISLIILKSGYILFEFAICLIQAYIFCLLISLYSDDHSSLH